MLTALNSGAMNIWNTRRSVMSVRFRKNDESADTGQEHQDQHGEAAVPARLEYSARGSAPAAARHPNTASRTPETAIELT